MKKTRLYYQMTDGIRISVRPVFAPEHSDIREPRFVFVYFIRIENLGDRTVQLLWRHWDIHDDVAGDTQVEGEGVVGEQPTIAPGEVHEYNSFCVLRCPSGYMEGWYDFGTATGESVRAVIPRFILDANGGTGAQAD
jgi:ApaG protein